MNRRQFIAGGIGAGMLGLAGCIETISGGGGGGTESFGAVGEWLPAPTEFDTGLEHYSVSAGSPSSKAAQVSESVFEGTFRPSLQFANPTAADTDLRLSGTGSAQNSAYQISFSAYIGSFNPEWVGDNVLRNNQFEQGQDYEGFNIYNRQAQTAIAVSESAYLSAEVAGNSPDAERAVTLIIDSSLGNVGRYAEEHPDMPALADGLPSAHDFSAETFEPVGNTNPASGMFENLVGRGSTTRINGAVNENAQVLQFTDEGDVRERDIEEYIVDSGQFSNYRGRPEFSINGPQVVIEGTVPR